MADVILYAALKENARLSQEYVDIQQGGVGLDFYSTPQSAGYPYTGGSGTDPLSPQIMRDWQRELTPLITPGDNGFRVCTTTGNFRCGASCTWSVPAGVTRARFQLWGPGGSTSSNCCCGGAPFGPSGAYATVELDVTAGDSYTLCAGCAYCCCATQTTPGLCGGPSFVTGPGLCVCADSGISCYCHWGQDIQATNLADGSCGIPNPPGQVCSPNSCSGWNFCWDSGNDDVIVEHAFSRQTWNVSCAGTGRNLVCYGINGIWPYMRIGTSLSVNTTCTVSSPVFGFERFIVKECFGSTTSVSGSCRQAVNGFLQIPGAGGYASRVFGGCNACGGDHGRMGMICVSWS